MGSITYGSATDIGSVRSENQDAFGSLRIAGSAPNSSSWLFIVADGMGGHAGGKEASRLAVETVTHLCAVSHKAVTPALLHDALVRANDVIYEQSLNNPRLSGMGTTCSALLINGREAAVAHIGDSRIYYVFNGTIRQLTLDHSKVAEMMRRGMLTEEEAKEHPERSMLLRALGVTRDAQVDVVERIPAPSGAVFILCTDGLSNLVQADELRHLVQQHPPEEACKLAVLAALDRGGFDNITIQVVRVD